MGRVLRLPMWVLGFFQHNGWVLFTTYIMLNIIIFTSEVLTSFALVYVGLYDNRFAWWAGQGFVLFAFVWFLLWRLGGLRWRSTSKRRGFSQKR